MSLVAKQPVAGLEGADPPFVLKRWTKVVLDKILPPVGPSSVPIAVSSKQAIEPVFGQLWSVPAITVVAGVALAHTLLLSKELCQVALPKATGCGAATGGLRQRNLAELFRQQQSVGKCNARDNRYCRHGPELPEYGLDCLLAADSNWNGRGANRRQNLVQNHLCPTLEHEGRISSL